MRVLFDPEDLEDIVCEACLEPLAWVAESPSEYLCDATAVAECCGLRHVAYSEGLRIFSEKADIQ